MCGICGAINLRGEPIPDLPRSPRGDERPDRPSRARRRRALGARARPCRLRPPPPEHHRPDPGRPPADARRGRALDHLQRRGLQLPRAAARARRARSAPTATPRSCCARTTAGAPTRSTACAGCSRTRSGTRSSRSCSARATASGSSRSTTRRSATSSTSRPRRRRCCRSCRAIETDLDGLKDYLAFQFCLAGKTLFEGVRELLPGHRLRVRDGRGRAGALLGGLLRPRLRPHGEVLRGADRGAAGRVGEAAPAQRRAGRRVSQRRARLERASRRSPAARRRARMKAFTGRFPEDERYDESRYARARRRRARPRPARDRHRRRRLPRLDREGHLPPRLPGGRARLVPAVHGLRRPPRARPR